MSTEILKFQATRMISAFLPIMNDPDAVKAKFEEIEIAPPVAQSVDGFNNRIVCPDWWMRTLAKKRARDQEEQSINQGFVKRGKEIYCSDTTVEKVQSKKILAKKFMDEKIAVSDQGDEVSMLDLLSSSIANPDNRLAELMVRMTGFQDYARKKDHVADFYTLTTPSKYHKYKGQGFNPKHQHNPKEGQKYLVSIWAKIRAQFSKHNIKVYGFRVAEPHHDGTPHWHMLLFMKPEYRVLVRELLHKYACDESSAELNHTSCCCPMHGKAQYKKPALCPEHALRPKGLADCSVRFDYVELDIENGSAAGYIAKYISKNLGFAVGSDSEDKTQSTCQTFDRVQSWSATWGIRQFQQIGGSSVSIWRELRKLKEEDLIEDQLIERARLAADDSDWALFLEIMGGADAKRIEQRIGLLKKNKIDTETGELKLNRYEEFIVRVVGICTHANEVITRLKEWQIVSKSAHDSEKKESANAGEGEARRMAFSSTWSPVINCN